MQKYLKVIWKEAVQDVWGLEEQRSSKQSVLKRRLGLRTEQQTCCQSQRWEEEVTIIKDECKDWPQE